MMTFPGEAGEGAGGGKSRPAETAAAPDADTMSMDDLRAEVLRLRDRERQIVELIGARAPDKIMHDLRNLLNEVQLLRILAEQGNA
jgi:hypothetical protein